MESKNTISKENVILGLFWKLLERGGWQLIQFVIQIVLARFLLPSDYGAISIVNVFIAIANVFVQSGLGSALIQKEKVTEETYSSVFYYNIGISIIMVCIIFFGAPIIAKYYQMEILVSVLRVQSLVLMINALFLVQSTILQKSMQFKKIFFTTIIAVFVSGTLGIYLAYMNFGIWALVIQQLTNAIIQLIALRVQIKWKPKHVFKISEVSNLLKFGSKVLFIGLLETTYNNIYTLVIAKIYSSGILGYYSRACQVPATLTNSLNSTIQGVMLPTFSQYQNDRIELKRLLRKTINIACFIIFPIIIFIILNSKEITLVLLGEKWLLSAGMMQIICCIYMLQPIQAANLQAIMAIGKSGLLLKIQLIQKAISMVVLIISVQYNIYVMLWLSFIAMILGSTLYFCVNKKIFNYTFKEQFFDIFPSLFLAMFIFGACRSIEMFFTSKFLFLIVLLVLCFVCYFFIAYIFKMKACKFILKIFKASLKK